MEYSQLQKDFKEKDVQRLRNLITEKYGHKTGTQVGHDKVDAEHKEGEVWEESGKTWTIKDGLKQTFTKLDAIKKTIRMPWACPSCKNAMKHPLDKKYYSIHKECHMCTIKKETLMRLNGTYMDYVNGIVTSNTVTFIDEAEQFIEDYTTQSDDVFYTESGEKEIFVGGSNKNLKVEEWKKELEEMRTALLDKDKNLNPPI